MNVDKSYGIDVDNFNIAEELAVFDDLRMTKHEIAVRIYIEPEMTPGGIVLPPKIQDEAEYQKCVGLLVKKAPYACKGGLTFDLTGDESPLGKWYIFPRHQGYKIKYKGRPIWIMQDKDLGPGTPDPRFVTR